MATVSDAQIEVWKLERDFARKVLREIAEGVAVRTFSEAEVRALKDRIANFESRLQKARGHP